MQLPLCASHPSNLAARWQIGVQPWGAHILSATRVEAAQSREIFYLSPFSSGPGAPVRGGVPVLFPQFNELGPLPKHGLARTARWSLLHTEVQGGATIGARLGLELEPTVHPAWPHSASLSLAIETAGDALTITLVVTNGGVTTFDWTGGLHPYFAVDDIRQCALTGLEEVPVADKTTPALSRQPTGPVTWLGDLFERLYDSDSPVVLETGGYRLRLSMRGFDQWMVWNPGGTVAAMLPDLPDADWRRFVCVEPVRVARPGRLEPGESFVGQLEIRYLKDQTARRQVC